MEPTKIIEILKNAGFDYITGVPCSFLKSLLLHLQVNKSDVQHVIANNEGEALGIAAGYHLATNKIPVVYLQNSGFGNIVNALTSLTSDKIYSIPILILLSWRGKPGTSDEPQHKMMGEVMEQLLKTLNVPYVIGQQSEAELAKQIQSLKEIALKKHIPVALIIEDSNFFKECKYTPLVQVPTNLPTREEALEVVLQKSKSVPIVSTTGKTSREIYEIRSRLNHSHQCDFLTVGSMGHASSIALGIALNTHLKTIVIDGDGAVLMRMGILAVIGSLKPKNYIHIVIDNGMYESTGGQPTVSSVIDWSKLFKSVGYVKIFVCNTLSDVHALNLSRLTGPVAIVIKVKNGSRKNLGRPRNTPLQNKELFQQFLKKQKKYITKLI